ncbi:short chain dehydrogenase [Prolixibacteraceae bacterium]|nr:short chain dehydrogenase [Prolixibacteraceae bacterium]
MKKIVLVGSTGVIGSKVKKLFEENYHVVTVNRTSGDFRLDMADAAAVEDMFKKIGSFDALITTSGYGKWGTIDEHSIQDYHDGLNSKLMGQVNMVVIGRKYANPGASFVVSTGILAQYPVPGGISLGMINAGLEAFVRGAALDMENMTINSVSPSFAKETMELMGMDSSTGVPAVEFAKLYKEAIESGKSGEIFYAK